MGGEHLWGMEQNEIVKEIDIAIERLYEIKPHRISPDDVQDRKEVVIGLLIDLINKIERTKNDEPNLKVLDCNTPPLTKIRARDGSEAWGSGVFIRYDKGIGLDYQCVIDGMLVWYEQCEILEPQSELEAEHLAQALKHFEQHPLQ